KYFDWNRSAVVTAHDAFQYDFTVKNVIPNASGLVFRKPVLTDEQKERLFQYKFAGDWYFYALLLRGGKLGYCRDARSYFRVSQNSASRSAFFTDRHLAEHQMIIDDLRDIYQVGEEAVTAHVKALAVHFPGKGDSELLKRFEAKPAPASASRPLRICIAAHSFETGGGELLPLALANTLRELNHHVTYLVMEKAHGRSNLRARLRPDISVVYWEDVQNRFDDFLNEHGIEIFNSHNVSVEYQLFCRDVKINRPYIASLHGGYETVADLLKGPFSNYLSTLVSRWLYLAEKNVKILTDHGLDRRSFEKSFNAVPEFAGPFEERDAFVAAHSIDPAAFIFVQCSRAIKEKGWRNAALAIREASKTVKRPLHLVLIGDGPDLASLREEFAEERRVTFMGHVDNPVRYFRCFDAAIFPSYFKGETFPLFLLECFQAGLPVIASRIGEIPQLFEVQSAGGPGDLIEFRGDEPDLNQLLRAVVKFVEGGDSYRAMSNAAHVVAAKFDMKQLAGLYVRTCSSLLKA
ncbi:MAG: glycosyltransferase family 4 protein, partial [Bradyrhizobium sp.]